MPAPLETRNRFSALHCDSPLLPVQYMISSIHDGELRKFHRQMVFPVELRGERRSVKTMAMIDSGASSIFIHKRFIDNQHVWTVKLDKPISLVNADDTANKIGAITEQVRLKLILAEHEEEITASVAEIGEYDLIIGVNWLRHHNPDIDWKEGSLELSRCPTKCTSSGTRVFEPRADPKRRVVTPERKYKVAIAEVDEDVETVDEWELEDEEVEDRDPEPERAVKVKPERDPDYVPPGFTKSPTFNAIYRDAAAFYVTTDDEFAYKVAASYTHSQAIAERTAVKEGVKSSGNAPFYIALYSPI